MSTISPVPSPKVHQLKIALRDISPLIWRRVLVTSDTTIAFLHDILQTVMGWEDIHLHRFRIYGKAYGVYRPGGIIFDDNPHRIRLTDFRFRPGERFIYEYDFGAWWCHDIRLERVIPLDPKRCYPVCIGGASACPPEDCAGPAGYRAYLDTYDSGAALWQAREDMAVLAQRLLVFMDGGPRPTDEDEEWADAFERLRLRLQAEPGSFNLRAVNQALRQLTEEGSCTFASS